MHELAPGVLVRAPAWPVATLQPFALATAGEPTTAPACADLIARERKSLWALTAGDPRFMTALLLSSPSLYARVQRSRGPLAPPDRSARQMEAALYRCLARASTRATPAGLWAGVTMAGFGRAPHVTKAGGAVACAPDLRPWAALLAGLALRPDAVDCAAWRLAPTLREHAPGHWRWLAREADGTIVTRSVHADRALGEAFARLARCAPGTLATLGTSCAVPIGELRLLAQAGALVGGLRLPARFTDPAAALEEAADRLPCALRPAWMASASQVAEACAACATAAEAADAPGVAKALSMVRTALVALGESIGVASQVPSVPIRVDLRLPWRIAFGPATHAGLLSALAALESRWQHSPSPGLARWQRQLGALRHRMSAGSLPLGEPLPAAVGGDHAGEPDALSPWGALQFQPGRDGVLARIGGVDPSPWRPFARFHTLLGDDHGLQGWLAEAQARIEQVLDARIAELAFDFETNPNALCRPSLAPMVSPWSVEGLALAGARLRLHRGLPMLDVPGAGPLLAFASCAAVVPAGDPAIEAIAATGFDLPATAAAAEVRGQCAQSENGITRQAAVALENGVPLRPRACVISGRALDELLRLRAGARLQHWRALGRASGWADTVGVSIDGAPAVYVPAGSPTALSAALAGAPGARALRVEDALEGARLDTEDGAYAAEGVVAFARRLSR
jgi:hypothetical protein